MAQYPFSYVRLTTGDFDLPIRSLLTTVPATFPNHAVQTTVGLMSITFTITPDLDAAEAQQLTDLVEASRVAGTPMEAITYVRNQIATGYDLTNGLGPLVQAALPGITVYVRMIGGSALIDLNPALDAAQRITLDAVIAAERVAPKITPQNPILAPDGTKGAPGSSFVTKPGLGFYCVGETFAATDLSTDLLGFGIQQINNIETIPNVVRYGARSFPITNLAAQNGKPEAAEGAGMYMRVSPASPSDPIAGIYIETEATNSEQSTAIKIIHRGMNDGVYIAGLAASAALETASFIDGSIGFISTCQYNGAEADRNMGNTVLFTTVRGDDGTGGSRVATNFGDFYASRSLGHSFRTRLQDPAMPGFAWGRVEVAVSSWSLARNHYEVYNHGRMALRSRVAAGASVADAEVRIINSFWNGSAAEDKSIKLHTTYGATGDPVLNLSLGDADAEVVAATLQKNGVLSIATAITTTKRLVFADSPYAALPTDEHIFCDTTDGAITVTLPAGINGKTYTIVNSGKSGNGVTVTPNGAELIDGVNASIALSDGGGRVLTYGTTAGWLGVGGGAAAGGGIITNWSPYLPDLVGLVNIGTGPAAALSGLWRRVGDSADVRIRLALDAPDIDTGGSATWEFGLPPGLTAVGNVHAGRIFMTSIGAGTPSFDGTCVALGTTITGRVVMGAGSIILSGAAPFVWGTNSHLDLSMDGIQIAEFA